MSTTLEPVADPVLAGGMKQAIADFDWATTPLGDMESWPQSLRTAVEIITSARFAMCMAWGPELTFLYNDAYAPILGARHPSALGRRLPDIWPDVWPDIVAPVEAVMAGESVAFERLHLVMTRNGYDEDTWWDFAYSPLRDESGAVAGLLDVVMDATATVLNERRLQQEQVRLTESERRFRALVDASAEVIYRANAEFDAIQHLDGVAFRPGADKPLTHWIDTFIHEDDQALVRAEVERAVASREELTVEHRMRNADGSTSWILSRAIPIIGDDGGVVEWFGTATDVTAAHAARDALASSKEKLELATQAARMGQFDYWPQTGVLEWDDRCRALFGLTPGAPVTYESAYVAGLHPDDRKRATEAVVASLDPAGNHVFDTEYRTIGIEDGVLRHIHAQGVVLFDGDRAVRLIGTVQDVSAERQREAALRETEERLRLANRATNDAIWDWDLLGDHVLWNEAIRSGYGHDLPDGTSDGGWWIEHIHPDDRPRIDRSIHAVIEGGGTEWRDEYRFRRADGSYADIKDRGSLIRDAEGRAVRMIGAMLDQTDRKDIERELAEVVEERTRERDQIWQATPDMLCVATFDGHFRALNPAWEETLGFSEAELVGQPFMKFVHPDDAEATSAIMSGLVAGQSIFGFENRYRALGGRYVWLNWNAVPRGDLIYSVVRDVTAAHEQADALAAAEDQLRQAQKMEAVGQLTGGIAHDFNNMLTGVLGSLELLRRYIAEGRSDRIDRYIEAAATSAQRAAALTQRLLAFSRRQSLDVQPVDVNATVRGMEDLLNRTLGEATALHLDLDPDAWAAVTDANQLESALLNLAINARDAMPAGGRLTVRSTNVTLDEAAVRYLDDVTPGDYVAIAVADTGMGMSEQVVAKAFDPFFTTKPIGQGTGLGLSMIYGFARQSGGHVGIDSALGAGTTVTLYLPRHAGEVSSAPPSVVGPMPAGRGECIMVVEDDPAVRMLIVDVLENLGYDVITAADGRQAIAMLDERPAIRLLVTDVGLPGVNGRQVAAHAREKLPGLRVLFVTGYAEQAANRASFLVEGTDMILKPFPLDILAAKVREMVEGAATA
ncbi:PAS domain-containing protein [Sphingomonas sp. ID0503]|uniref:hybrid sensor histidine kinase/response regulator n=1 Tax=Sphingomonas sp. ID0503 TaxID=3399691 RepID=UPI003AFA8BDB